MPVKKTITIRGRKYWRSARELEAAERRGARPKSESCDHKWSPWKIVGHTGDWFHPHIVERECKKCRACETDEH